MDEKQWLSEVRSTLGSAGLPTDYVRRTILELSDHVAEQSELDPGHRMVDTSPHQLSGQLVTAFRSATWFRKLPNWFWFVAPIPISMVVCLTYYGLSVLLIILCCESFEWRVLGNDNSTSVAAVALLTLVLCVGKLLTPLLAALAMIRGASRAGKPLWVRYGSLIVLAFVFLVTTSELQLPNRFSEGSMTLEIGTDWVADVDLLGWQIAQALVVCTTAFLAVAINRSKNSRSEALHL